MTIDLQRLADDLREQPLLRQHGFEVQVTAETVKGEVTYLRYSVARDEGARAICTSVSLPGTIRVKQQSINVDPGYFSVMVSRHERDAFLFFDYLRQYHGLYEARDEPDKFSDYAGSVGERCRAFHDFLWGLIEQHAKPVIVGDEYPTTRYNWR